jgi:hypothetical protein
LLVCVFAFAGCTKADSATLLMSYNIYIGLTNDYAKQENTSKIIFVKEKIDEENDLYSNAKIDLYSSSSYSTEIYNSIDAEDGYFKLLKQGNQYQAIMQGANILIENYDTYLNAITKTYEEEVEQSLKTDLYVKMQKMSSACSALTKSKQSLTTICSGGFKANDVNIKENLKKYLSDYKNLIDTALEVNITFEKIYTTYMVTISNTSIKTGEYQRLIYSAELYLARYFYINYMQFESDVFADFSTDENFKSYITILSNGVLNKEPESSDTQSTYNYSAGISKLDGFATDLDNLVVARQNTSNEAYKNYVDSFSTKVENLENFFIKNILGIEE